MFRKTGRLLLFLSMISEVTVQKSSNYTFSQIEKAIVQKLVTGFWTVSSNHKVNKYWTSADLLFLIKNNVKWLLLKRFVDVVKLYPLDLITRNYSNTFLLINLQKKIRVQSEILKQGLFVLLSSCHFRHVFVHYFFFFF